MAVQFIEVTGKTENEAIEKALAQLGESRDNVSVEILERAKSGFLGFGAKPAKIRVTYGEEDPAPVAPPVQKPKPVVPAAVKQTPTSTPQERPKETSTQQEKAEHPAKPGKPAHPQPQRRPGRAAAGVSDQEKPAVPAAQSEDLGELCHDDTAQEINGFLTGLLQRMGSEATVKVYLPEEDRYQVILEGDKLGALIGRRGDTLDAIQQLTSYSVNRGRDKRVRIHIDAENYRLKREQSLQHLALKVAAKVVKSHRSVTLEPMNAYERHVIHTALQDVDNVYTYSMGSEPNRRVIIAFDRGNRNSAEV